MSLPRKIGAAALVAALASLLMVSGAGSAPGGGAPAGKPRGAFLTGPNAGKPLEIALRYLMEHRRDLGLTAADLDNVGVSDQYVSRHTGVTHIYLQQRHEGIELFNGLINVNVAKDGSVVNVGSRFVGNLAGKANRTAPVRAPVEAVELGARALGLRPTEQLRVIQDGGGPARAVVVSDGGISARPIPAKLVFQPAGRNVRLAWNLQIDERSGEHYWSANVDAETGDLLAKHDFVDQDNAGATGAAVARSSRGSRMRGAATAKAVADGSSYNVFALPKESPSDGDRTIENEPADATASPFGWHDTNGAVGAEFTITRGNNVEAATDLDADDFPDAGSQPDGGAGLDFDPPLDLSQQPSGYRDAAVVNLFYFNNIVHDVLYGVGFDEAGGNFQINNYGKGGAGNDEVKADAQDGSGTNNANFLTLPDGLNPRMQMFTWQPALPNFVTVHDPSPIAGDYDASGAAFGPRLDETGVTGEVGLADDNVGPNENDGCEAIVGFTADIAIVDRGNCNFTVKVKNAQNAGAIGVIVVQNTDGPPVTMGAQVPDPTIVIPSVMVTKADGNSFKANLPLDATLRAKGGTEPDRDSDLDNGVIAHEYGHGWSNRLTGGPGNTLCLENDEQMGEGWSDYLALVLTAVPEDMATTSRGIGTYVVFQPPDGIGIRPTAYTTDMGVNPSTYDTIKTAPIPHGVGYVWATMIWEVYWNLVELYGFNPDVYGDWTTGGNNLALQLVSDGLKLQPCGPGFVDGRDAILAADQALTEGENQCAIWRGFAKRGLGVTANQGSPLLTTDGTQAFDLPAQCGAAIALNPSELESAQFPDEQVDKTLSVANNAAPGGADLEWSITEAASDCGSPSDLPWVDASPADGTTDPGESSDVTVTFDSTGLDPGSSRSGKLCVASNDPVTPVAEVPLTLQVLYKFSGFFGVKNPPALNRVRAGSNVRPKFSLDGFQGFGIFAPGSPASQPIDCSTKVPTGDAEPTTGALVYNSSTDRYTYRWKTESGWAGTCRELIVTLDDGSDHRAYFRFRS